MVSSQVRYTIKVYWGVSIRELHIALWSPWSTLREAALNDKLLVNHFQQAGKQDEYPFFVKIILYKTLN